MVAGTVGFIGEPIAVEFDEAPALAKVPGCPDRFVWRDVTFQIVQVFSEWHDYRRRGDMSRNMEPHHLLMARRRGSWGVGRDYFRVRVEAAASSEQPADSGGRAPPLASRVFELYYDRAPSAGGRKGGWFLYREIRSDD